MEKDYKYKTVYDSLPNVDSFEHKCSILLNQGWIADGDTHYVSTPPTGKIICIQRFKKCIEPIAYSSDIDSTFG